MKKHKTNTKHDVRFQKYFENNSPIVRTDKTNNSKIYKNNICEKSFKHHSALKKHKAKAHNLIKGLSFDYSYYNHFLNCLINRMPHSHMLSPSI